MNPGSKDQGGKDAERRSMEERTAERWLRKSS